MNTLLVIYSLAHRELLRFYRQRSRIVGSLAMPIIFWALLGAGLDSAVPKSENPKEFLQYFFPGNLILTLVFTAIFSTISIIEDRHEGFLQAVLVAPVSSLALVSGKVLGGALLALFQGSIFLLLAPIAGITLNLYTLIESLVVLFGISLTMTSLGFWFAWRTDSVQGFHAIMNLVLFPMWLLSGTFFPVEKAPLILKPLMYLNPLTYGLVSLREAFAGEVLTSKFAFGLASVFAFSAVFWVLAILGLNRFQSSKAAT